MCEFCNGELKKHEEQTDMFKDPKLPVSYLRVIPKNVGSNPNEIELHVFARHSIPVYFNIKFCPMCGKDLNQFKSNN